MSPSVWVAVGSLLLALLALLLGLIQRRNTEGRDLSDRMARLEVKVEVFWRNVAFDAAKVLHSPHSEWARRDALLDQFMAGRLDPTDAPELYGLMQDAANSERDGGRRIAASMVLHYLDVWLEERGVVLNQ